MTHGTITTLDDIDALEQALTSDDPKVRGMARAFANGWPRQFEQWFNSECQRNASNLDAFQLANLLFIQILASIMAQSIKPEGDEPTARAIAKLVLNTLPASAAARREQIKPKAAAQ